MTWDIDAAKSEYSVTDMTVSPNITYFFDKKKRFMSAWARYEAMHIKYPAPCVGWSEKDVPLYIRECING